MSNDIDVTSNQLHVDTCATVDMVISAVVLMEINDTLADLNSNDSSFDNLEIISDINKNEESAAPHVSIQLDILNQRNEAINKLEVEYEDQLRIYTSMVHESNKELNKIEKKLGDCVRISFPYYNALDDLFAAKANRKEFAEKFEKIQFNLRQIHDFIEHYEHATAYYSLSNNWIEMAELANRMAGNFNDKRKSVDATVQKWSDAVAAIEQNVKDYQSGNTRSIRRARPFYDRRFTLRKSINDQESLLSEMKTCILEAKGEYQNALRRLEMISNEIHKHRTNSTVSE